MLAAGPDALLRVDRPFVRPRAGAEEDVLELVHAGIGEQQRGVVMRHDARRGHEGVPVLLDEEVDELLTDLGGSRHENLSVTVESTITVRTPCAPA